MRNTSWRLAATLVVLLGYSTVAHGQWPTKTWPTSTPSAVGLDESVLMQLDADIASGKLGYVDSMLIIRHGQIAYERTYKHDYGSIYSQQSRIPGPLIEHDPTGPYNYVNPWWQPSAR